MARFSSVKHWLFEKLVIHLLEETGQLPEGTEEDIMFFTLMMAVPPGAMKMAQYPVARMMAVVDPGGFNPKYSVGSSSSRNLLTDTSGGRVRVGPSSRPATVNYRVGRIGGGMMSIPALNLGLGILVAGTMLDFIERDFYITDVV